MKHLLPFVRRRRAKQIRDSKGNTRTCDSRELERTWKSEGAVGKRPSEKSRLIHFFFFSFAAIFNRILLLWSVGRNATDCTYTSLFVVSESHNGNSTKYGIVCFSRFSPPTNVIKPMKRIRGEKKDTSCTVQFFRYIFNPTFDVINFCKDFYFLIFLHCFIII